jgi:hypothetical protein
MRHLTDEQLDRAADAMWDVLRHHMPAPHSAKLSDFANLPNDKWLAAVKDADRECARKNQAIYRRAAAAAIWAVEGEY